MKKQQHITSLKKAFSKTLANTKMNKKSHEELSSGGYKDADVVGRSIEDSKDSTKNRMEVNISLKSKRRLKRKAENSGLGIKWKLLKRST